MPGRCCTGPWRSSERPVMKRLEDAPADPEIGAALDAIDATLAGEPVDPRHAELAELALMLAAERPTPDARVAAALDSRVERRFAKPSVSAPGVAPPSRRRWLWAPAAGLAGAAVVAIVIVVSGPSGSSRPQLPASASARSAPSSAFKAPHAARGPAPTPLP